MTAPPVHDPHSLSAHRVAELIADRRIQVVDLRSPGQWYQGHVRGARNITLEGFPDGVFTLDRELPIVVYANDEPAAAEAAEVLRGAGITAYAMAGGLDDWRAAGHPVERGE